jgi:hypothetical protein
MSASDQWTVFRKQLPAWHTYLIIELELRVQQKNPAIAPYPDLKQE